MRRLQLFIATSLDGCIAGPRGEIDWLFSDADYGYRRFTAGVDAVVMGRKTWSTALSFEERPFAGKEVVVFSRKAKRASFPHVTIVDSDPARHVRAMKRRRGKSIWLVGGGSLNGALLKAGLVDDLIVSIHPVVLGKGIPLAAAANPSTRWTLVKTKAHPSGLVQLTYRKAGRS